MTVGISAAIWSGTFAWNRWGARGERFGSDIRVRQDAAVDGRHTVTIDTDGDLIFDTWSHYSQGTLVEMVFDDDQDGRPDRRRLFNRDGSVERTESLAGQAGR